MGTGIVNYSDKDRENIELLKNACNSSEDLSLVIQNISHKCPELGNEFIETIVKYIREVPSTGLKNGATSHN